MMSDIENTSAQQAGDAHAGPWPVRDRQVGSPTRTPDFGRGTSGMVTCGVASAPGLLPTEYVRPPGLSLLFCSAAEIAAAPPAEREGYYRVVESLCANPEAYGFRYETAMDLAREDAADRRTAAANQDWGS